jgi:hypothetical protein
MRGTNKPDAGLWGENKSVPVALFKNSLRMWQARWKAQKEAQAAAPKEEERPARAVLV